MIINPDEGQKLLVYYAGQDQPDRYSNVTNFKEHDNGKLTFTGVGPGGVTGKWTLSNTYKAFILQEQ